MLCKLLQNCIIRLVILHLPIYVSQVYWTLHDKRAISVATEAANIYSGVDWSFFSRNCAVFV